MVEISAGVAVLLVAWGVVVVLAAWAWWDVRTRPPCGVRERRQYWERKAEEHKRALWELIDARTATARQELEKRVAIGCARQLYENARAAAQTWKEMERDQ